MSSKNDFLFQMKCSFQLVLKLLFFKKNFSFESLPGIFSGLNIYFQMQQQQIVALSTSMYLQYLALISFLSPDMHFNFGCRNTRERGHPVGHVCSCLGCFYISCDNNSSLVQYLAAGRNISEREADISEILVILFVALDIFPLADGLSQVHHAQRNLYLNNKHY